MESILSQRTMTALNAALQAGALLRSGFQTSFTVRSKEGIHNLVTEYDHKAENLIISFIAEQFPDDQFLGEEGGLSKSGSSGFEWVIDPLDGTVNFAHGVPVFAVSIGCRRGKELLLGIVYQPITQEIFIAEKGKGAFCNGKKLQVTTVDKVQNSILATGFPYNLKENPFGCIEKFFAVLKQGIPVRRIGAASIDLAYVAAGKFDGFFEVTLQPWDMAAGILLIQEAGGRASDWQGNILDIDSNQPILVSNGKLHGELQKILAE